MRLLEHTPFRYIQLTTDQIRVSIKLRLAEHTFCVEKGGQIREVTSWY